jgi:hypothetical protein
MTHDVSGGLRRLRPPDLIMKRVAPRKGWQIYSITIALYRVENQDS